MSDIRIAIYEWLAGKFIVRSARLRARRMGPVDAHEIRHLFAAITAGNSDPCDCGGDCHLDQAMLRNAQAPLSSPPTADRTADQMGALSVEP